MSSAPPTLSGPLVDHARAGFRLLETELRWLRHLLEGGTSGAVYLALDEAGGALKATEANFQTFLRLNAEEMAAKLADGLPAYPKGDPSP